MRGYLGNSDVITDTNRWSLEVSTAPTIDGNSRDDLKAHLRIDTSAEDGFLDTLLAAARSKLEKDTRRAINTQTLKLYMDKFPNGSWLELPRPPLISVTSITYTDTDGNSGQTYSSSNYQVDAKSTPGMIRLGRSVTGWPSVLSDTLNAVTITYTAGYGATNASVPADLRHALKLLYGHWYTNRDALGSMQISKELELSYNSLIQPYVLPWVV